MKMTSWGKYPVIDAQVEYLSSSDDELPNSEHVIARGLGRSYGDSALANHILHTKNLDYFHAFDDKSGLLTCDAGVSLEQILTTFVPKGWFLSVTPGTKFVTIGGAIASDVHGKNHHKDGSFCDFVVSMDVLTESDGVVSCSREENSELFNATCGGQGLTGVILSASFTLKPIKSAYIRQKTIKAKNVQELVQLFNETEDCTYSVAWIDCLATGEDLGRSLLMLGEHDDAGALTAHKASKLSVPFNLPSFTLNPFTVQAFNALYYAKERKKESESCVNYEPFFYPLDCVSNWNNIYGKNGFTQYQCVIPKSAGVEALMEILEKISEAKQGSFLAVLKLLGKENDNYLSFPMEGYTLALDFKLNDNLFPLLDALDVLVKKYEGRLYLTKDVRMSEETFKAGYPKWEAFNSVRKRYQANKKFNSLQSQRIGL